MRRRSPPAHYPGRQAPSSPRFSRARIDLRAGLTGLHPVGRRLRLAGGNEESAVIHIQELQPTGDIGGVIGSWIMRQPKVGQEEGGGQFDAAEVIGGTFNLTVAPAVLSERAAFHHATASGRSAPELDMESKASAELAALWRWTRGQLRQSTGGPVALADARA